MRITILHSKKMEKDRLINYYCSDDFLELYLGGFRISDRPKRMIFRFLSEENLADTCDVSSPIKTAPLLNQERPDELLLYPITAYKQIKKGFDRQKIKLSKILRGEKG